MKFNIDILPKTKEETPEPSSAKRKLVRPEKLKPSPKSHGKLGILESPGLKPPTEKEYHLPPAIAKPGEEHKPIYSLVLDMDETLIHFEEVFFFL